MGSSSTLDVSGLLEGAGLGPGDPAREAAGLGAAGFWKEAPSIQAGCTVSSLWMPMAVSNTLQPKVSTIA